MIERITRQYVFDNYRKLTSEITQMQQSMFDEDDLFATPADKQSYINAHDALNQVQDDTKTYFSTITFDHEDINTFTAAITAKLTSIFSLLQVSHFIVIANMKQAYIGRPDNKFKPFQEAVSKFRQISGDLKYKEAFKISLADLPDFIDILFWIGRCDASAPSFIFFCDTAEKISFTLCQYGGIHITSYDVNHITGDVLESAGMHFVKGRCEEKFSDSSKINGRMAAR